MEPLTGLRSGEAVVGFSTESILEALGGTLDPLLDAIKSGAIRGVAGLVSCTTLRDSGQDAHSVAVAKELIARDILILSMGCGNGAMQVAGLCMPEAAQMAGPGLKAVCEKLGVPPVLSYGTCTDTGRIADLLAAVSGALGDVPIPDLPVVAAAPEYMEQKATMDAVFALALGLYTYVNPVPTVTGGPNLVKLLTEDCADVTGGVMRLETDAAAGGGRHARPHRGQAEQVGSLTTRSTNGNEEAGRLNHRPALSFVPAPVESGPVRAVSRQPPRMALRMSGSRSSNLSSHSMRSVRRASSRDEISLG